MALAMYIYTQGDKLDGCQRLYKIELPSLTPPSDSGSDKKAAEIELELSPLLNIPYANYPRDMVCVQLGSVLYFLAGHTYPPGGLRTNSPNVYSFDTNHPTSGLKQCPSMCTGKPSPFTFVARGMIYVLARTDKYVKDGDSIKYFECFNPLDNTWHVLNDAPLRQDLFSYCFSSAVFENYNKVVIFAMQCSRLLRFVYDLEHDQWDSDYLLDFTEPLPPFVIRDVGDGGRYVYGFKNGFPAIPLKIGPVDDPYQFHKVKPTEISVVNADLSQILDEWRRKLLLARSCITEQLGDGIFCHVRAGQSCDSSQDLSKCPHTSRVSVIIFKELSTHVQGGEQQNPSFQAQILYTQDYVIKMLPHACSYIRNLFFVALANCTSRDHKRQKMTYMSSLGEENV